MSFWSNKPVDANVIWNLIILVMSEVPQIDPIDYVTFVLFGIVACANIVVLYFLFHEGKRFKWTLPFVVFNTFNQVVSPIGKVLIWTPNSGTAAWTFYGISVAFEVCLFPVVIYLNLEMLAMFAFLSNRITPKIILYGRIACVLEFIISAVFGGLSATEKNMGLLTQISIYNTLFVGLVLIGHNSWQTWWLLKKVYSYSTRNPDRIERVTEKYVIIKRYLLLLSGLDWYIIINDRLAVFCGIVALIRVPYAYVFGSMITIILGLHVISIIYFLEKLRVLYRSSIESTWVSQDITTIPFPDATAPSKK
jgi:hypothetical protein